MRNLLGRLHDRSPRSLARIAWFWEIDLRGRDPHRDLGRLYRTLTDPWSFAIGWTRLSQDERAIIETLSRDGAALSVSEIAARLGVTEDAARQATRQLYDAGLLHAERDEEELAPNAPRRLFVGRETALLVQRFREEQQRGLPDQDDVDGLLDRLDDGTLADIAEAMGHRVIPAVAGRADLLAAVKPRLADPDRIRDAVRALDPNARRLWDWLSGEGGSGAPDVAREALGLSGGALRGAIAALAQRGLIWRGWGTDGAVRIVVPEPVRRPKRPLPPPPPELRAVPAGDVEPVDWVHPYALAWDLLTALRAVAEGSLRGRGGELDDSAPAARRLAPGLWRRSGDLPPTGYLAFLDYHAKGLGLLEPDAAGVAIEPLRDWTRRSFPEQTSRLLDLWRAAVEWPEGAGRETLQVWGADWPGFRGRLLTALGQLTPGEWVTPRSFTDRFAALEPDALGAYFTAAAGREEPEESSEDRRRSVLRLAAEITLTTAGVWLGLVELSRARRETVLTLTEVGAWAVRGGEPPAAGSGLGDQPVSVQPDFTVLLLQPSPRRIWALSAFTEREALDRVSIYRLTRAGIQRGLAAGLSLRQMVRFLEEESGEPLPRNVAFELDEWAREYRRVRLRPALLLEPDERAAAGELAEALARAGLRVERLPGDRLLALLPADDESEAALRRIEETLRERGQTPTWPGGRRPHP